MLNALTHWHTSNEYHVLKGKRAEELFLSVPDEDSAIAASRVYAAKPHTAGTAGDLDTAKIFLAHLQEELQINRSSSDIPLYSAGSRESREATLAISSLDEPKAWIDVYYPILNSPLDRSLEILGDDGKPVWSAELEEVADETDPYAFEFANAVPAWHGISKGGQAEGKLIDAQYGRKRDYDALVEAGVDFSGKIVLTRSGGIFRGLKVKRAQELGAAAVLVYLDPHGDGTVTVENGYAPYPHGPARNPTSVERGAVQFLSLYPGDTSTPGYPSYENSTRVEGESKPTIPSLPISWVNAQVLLNHLKDGGDGPTVRLVNNVDEKITPIWNVMGVIPGHIKNEVVVLGAHRDAWVTGASDPISGTVSVSEAIRGFGALLRKGWRPLRTILITSWDAEEYGLIGSTEWGEDFPEWIKDHVVAYVNTDTSASGSRLKAAGSPLLAHLLRETAEQLPHPSSEKRSLWDAREDTGTLFGEHMNPEIAAMHTDKLRAVDSIGVRPLGSGSDYTVFLQYHGVPSTDGGFTSTLHDPVYHYHSIFDTQYWQELYGDPGFFRHVAIAKHIGLQVFRLSGDIILPFNTTHYSLELESYLNNVESIAATDSFDVDLSPLRESIHALQSASLELDSTKTKAEHKLRKILKEWEKNHAMRHKICRKVSKVLCKLKKVFGKHKCEREDKHDDSPHRRVSSQSDRHLIKAIQQVQAVNKRLIAFERGFISKDGIKDREWYKHLGVAPGRWLGYGATTFPGLTEALTMDRNVTAAAYEAGRLKDLVDNLVKTIRL
ncbi:Zn-dependent exopeptidase [Rhizopogon vinicolor AM-OR11-026]|uniref:Zn-dependent exopeptidase n=1 Tax=Rhizopogon vinicolor AM-OR11-026 TaxID=1314800 RepID=A0A1B7MZ59_9AGAM|nr:Zn-dependent exopeptidase [Rhizopogon vinicolor AM-OR11-026]